MPIPIYTKEARDVIAQTVRDNKQRKSKQPEHTPRMGGHGGLQIEITGPPVLVTTTTTPTFTTVTTTSTTGTTTSTTPCLGNNPVSIPTLPVLAAKYVYPARFVYRNIDALDNTYHYFPGEDCWAEEMNGRQLGFGCRYPGHISAEYRGQIVVAVRNDLPSAQAGLSCTSATTVTTCACEGFCEWALTASGWAVKVNNCNTGAGCNCPQPDFCPPDGGCANTITYCGHGANPATVLIDCNNTTTSTTGTGTTTTEDPCGECTWKFLGVEGNVIIAPGGPPTEGWTLLDHTCSDN